MQINALCHPSQKSLAAAKSRMHKWNLRGWSANLMSTGNYFSSYEIAYEKGTNHELLPTQARFYRLSITMPQIFCSVQHPCEELLRNNAGA